MSKRQKTIPRRYLIIVAVVVLLALGLALIMAGLGEARTRAVGRIDPSRLPDGVYSGRHVDGRWSCEVDVTVLGGRITAIAVTDDVTAAFITNCADAMMDRVLSAQNLDVDVAAGATATSKAYLKAIENALS